MIFSTPSGRENSPPGKITYKILAFSSILSKHNTYVAPAKTGRDNRSNQAVIKTLHTNSGKRS
jgi:hypothetical protein